MYPRPPVSFLLFIFYPKNISLPRFCPRLGKASGHKVRNPGENIVIGTFFVYNVDAI
ncbi:hypothetical protein HMPREF7215_2337 [Pyramidobacter piscolens W5455]|uniref:Uncharacterized protein n=1 Tax=Pyramidobacter piscolens W5455 TaxID=352165 RepID=A0ABM9ZYL1_9BACT|nr:hypothetical protein HMPREF7215_2337 [Pyramidobacter piscolens W5455]